MEPMSQYSNMVIEDQYLFFSPSGKHRFLRQSCCDLCFGILLAKRARELDKHVRPYVQSRDDEARLFPIGIQKMRQGGGLPYAAGPGNDEGARPRVRRVERVPNRPKVLFAMDESGGSRPERNLNRLSILLPRPCDNSRSYSCNNIFIVLYSFPFSFIVLYSFRKTPDETGVSPSPFLDWPNGRLPMASAQRGLLGSNRPSCQIPPFIFSFLSRVAGKRW